MKITKLTAGLLAAVMALSICACGKDKGADTDADTETKTEAKTDTKGKKQSKSDSDEIAITVGDAKMSKSDLELYVKNYSGSLDFDTAKEYAIRDAQDLLSTEAVFSAMDLSYTDEEKAAQQADIDSAIESMGGEDEFQNYLDQAGITEDFFKRVFNMTSAQEKIFADDISDDKVQKEFQDNYLRAKHILISTMDTSTQEKYDDAKIASQKALADELLKRAQDGEDFDALVSEYSEDPGSKSNPDGYYFTAGQMVQEFEDTTRSLGIDEIGMCESTYGYHIIKRLPLEDNAEALSAVRNQLLQTAVTDKLPGLMEQNGLKVEKNQDVIDSIEEPKTDAE